MFCRLSSCRLEESLSVSLRAHKEISDQLSTIVEMMRLQNQSSSANLVLEFSSGNVSPDSPRVNSIIQAPTGQFTPEAITSGSSRLKEDGTNHPSDFVQETSPVPIKEECTAWCSCDCHARSIIRSPWLMETIIGKISVQYAGRRPPCNEFHCHRSLGPPFKVFYQLPKYIMSRYILMVMQYAPSSGPEFLLRMPRMVPWSHGLWDRVRNGDLLAVQKLFAEGKASPYDLNPYGCNALVSVVKRNHVRLFKFLLEQGVDMDQPDNIGKSPSDLLWERPFVGECDSQVICAIKSMLRTTGHVQTQGFSTLHKIVLGISSKDLESELETSTAAINVGDLRNRTPLCWATIRNDMQAVKTLLAFGANPNVVDAWGHTPLDFTRRFDICKMLLDAGVNVHASNTDYSRSALHQLFQMTGGYSLHSDTVDMINLLVNAGIDVNVQDSKGETPLLNAVYSGCTSHVRRFLDLGADPNLYGYSARETAIHFAVSFDRHDMIPLLLERGADYTALNAAGSSIAHMAARSASTETISVLAESNLVDLDVLLRNKDGKTPADYLSERSTLTESEQGLHAEFDRFVESILELGPDAGDGISEPAVVHRVSDACDDLHLPGAYPAFGDPDVALNTRFNPW